MRDSAGIAPDFAALAAAPAVPGPRETYIDGDNTVKTAQMIRYRRARSNEAAGSDVKQRGQTSSSAAAGPSANW